MLEITKNFKIWFAVSAVLMLASIAALIIWGLVPGIDFVGGTLAEFKFENQVDSRAVRDTLAQDFNPTVQQVSPDTLLIKTKPLDEEMTLVLKEQIRQTYGEFTELRFETIGPTIGRELTRKAYWQIALVIIGIILYIAYAFRKISKVAKRIKLSAWKLGVATIIALVHDVLITVGVFAVLGAYHGVEVDTLFITALLTILGFSVHDTIVVFDRVRENLQKYQYKSIATIIDYSVNSTLARSINTSSTLIFVLIALLLFGGGTIFYFVLALLIGVIAGTYSSIFLASSILYAWSKE